MNEEDNAKWLERPIIKGIPIYTILLLIFMIALICLLFYIGLIITARYRIGIGKEYELFRDILTIILATSMLAITVLGYVIYQFILDTINKKQNEFLKDINEKQKKFLLYTTSLIDLNNGHSIWLEYEANKSPKRLNHAISLTEHAYSSIQKLDERKKRFDLLKCQILNNLSYYLAERKEEGDIELAKQYAGFFMERTQKYPKMALNWKHTNTFIRDAIIQQKTPSKKED